MNPRYREVGSSSPFRCSWQGLCEGENLPLDHEAHGDQPDKADIMNGESTLRNYALLLASRVDGFWALISEKMNRGLCARSANVVSSAFVRGARVWTCK